MNNSVFGKTMENVRNRSKIKIVNGQETEKLESLIAKPYYRRAFVFGSSKLVSVKETNNLERIREALVPEGLMLVSVSIGESTMVLNKPIYLGQAILDLSKTLMYDFHYGYVKPKYGDRARLLFRDTDSLCYQIQTEDFYEDISKDVPKWFDTSNYPKGYPIGGANKKVLGMMKDEAGGESISEFVGLRSKLYAYKMDDGKTDKKCKGVKKSVVKNSITGNGQGP